MAIFAMTTRNATTINVDQMAFSMPNALSAPSTKQSARLHQPRVSSFGEGASADSCPHSRRAVLPPAGFQSS